jgi:hypothetical protein
MEQQDIIDEIFRIRVINNMPWKRLIEIALKHAPAETRRELAAISENDQRISDLTRMLTQ